MAEAMILERELMEEEYMIGFGSSLTSIKHNLYEISSLINRFDLISEDSFLDTTLREHYRNRINFRSQTPSHLEKSIKSYCSFITDFERLIFSKGEKLDCPSTNFKILHKHTQRLNLTSNYLFEYLSKENNLQNYHHNFSQFVPALESSVESYNTINELKKFYDIYIDKKKATRNLFPHLQITLHD